MEGDSIDNIEMGVEEGEDEEVGNRLMFPFAGQPDIVRAVTKDEFCVSDLNHRFLEVLLGMFGPQFTQYHHKQIKLAAQLTYYFLTTLRGVQTIGEEYCDINLISTPLYAPLSVTRRLALMAISILLPYSITPLAKLFLSSKFTTPALSSFVRNTFVNPSPKIANLINIASQLHLAIFYLFGTYYNVAKRILRIKYVFNRKIHQPRISYGILGLLIFIQLFVRGGLFCWNTIGKVSSSPHVMKMGEEEDGEMEEVDEDDGEEQRMCTLCLCPRSFTTSTPCGHLFCWDCIHEACKVKAMCPICRRDLTLQSLCRVYHYV